MALVKIRKPGAPPSGRVNAAANDLLRKHNEASSALAAAMCHMILGDKIKNPESMSDLEKMLVRETIGKVGGRHD